MVVGKGGVGHAPVMAAAARLGIGQILYTNGCGRRKVSHRRSLGAPGVVAIGGGVFYVVSWVPEANTTPLSTGALNSGLRLGGGPRRGQFMWGVEGGRAWCCEGCPRLQLLAA